MKRKIIIAVAPVAHMEKRVPEGVINPVDPDSLAEEVVKCAENGASLVHLHVRDNKGHIVGNLDTFSYTINKIREKSDIIIQGSTGGVSDLSLDARSVSVEHPLVQMASLNMGTTNFGESIYVNSYPDIRYWANKMKKYDVVPELEIFDTSMIDTCLMMREEGVLSDPLHFNFSLGFKGCMAATADNLYILKSKLPLGAKWSILHEGMNDLSLLAAAISFGATGIRVGYEDGFYLGENRTASNSELVAAAAELVKMMGCEVATIDEAYNILEMHRK
ncbi:MAG: 3-keto-5-aminohexanoate cleavage protein [Spirochaetales bacterium]|nr:3-keto-5-aminohexanoate cleavage protein [Spirochaetales bacterium]